MLLELLFPFGLHNKDSCNYERVSLGNLDVLRDEECNPEITRFTFKITIAFTHNLGNSLVKELIDRSSTPVESELVKWLITSFAKHLHFLCHNNARGL